MRKLLLLSLFVSSLVHAADGTVHFIGKIVSTGMSIVMPDKDIDLGQIKIDSFKNGRSSVVIMPIQIAANGNVGTFTINLTINGVADKKNPELLQLEGAGKEGVAGGVGLRFSFAGMPLKVNEPTDLYKVTFSRPDEISKSLPISVGYEQTGKEITPGQANAVATLTLKYD